MGYVKVLKNKAYFKRYQTKFRRRREGKTDYYARKRLVAQAKDKYSSPRFRFVVRFSNRHVTCQVVTSELIGDKIICAAHSSELPSYGVKVGLKNYAATYCTGLLLARRLLEKFDMGDMYQGNPCDGRVRTVKYCKRTLYVEDLEWDSERRPFRCNLDVGLKPTTTGSKLFAAVKGASDGGLDIPHSVKRFAGYEREAKKYDAEEHRARILGEHVATYMRELRESDEDNFKKTFRDYIQNGVSADDVEDMYLNAHEAIRKDPKSNAEKYEVHAKGLAKKQKKRSYAQRKGRIKQKKAWHAWKEEQDDSSEEESDE